MIILLVALPQFIDNNYILQSFIMVLLFAYWATAWNIIGGFGGQFSLGNATYAGLGAYISSVLLAYYGISPWIGMIIGGLIGGIVGIIIGYPCFRLRGSYFTLSTIALQSVVRLLFVTEDTILGFDTKGALGFSIPWFGGRFRDMQFLSKNFYYYIILFLLFVVLLVSYKIKNSRTGYYLAAINTNQEAADSLGVNVTYYKLRAQFLSAFFTAIGGTFYAQLISYIDPNRVFSHELSVEIAVMAIIGGKGTILGPCIGAILLVPISEVTRSYLGTNYAGLSVVIYGLCLMLTVFYLPAGLEKYVRVLFNKISSCFGQKKHKQGGGVCS